MSPPLATSCTGGDPVTNVLPAASLAMLRQEWSIPAVPGNLAGAAPWKMAETGAVPAAVRATTSVAAGDDEAVDPESGVSNVVPQHAASHRTSSAVAGSADCIVSHHVQTSEFQGLSFAPADGLADACFKQHMPVEDTLRLGLA